MTPEQAITVFDALFSKLRSLQQSRLSPAPPLSDETNGLIQEDLSFDTISGAIWTLGNNDARPTFQAFIDQVFSSLYGKLLFSSCLLAPAATFFFFFFFFFFWGGGKKKKKKTPQFY